MKDAEKMLSGSFTMDDFLNQVKTIQSMGSMKDILEKMPLGQMFGANIPPEALEKAADDKELVRVEAMIRSMTKEERKDPELFLDDGEGPAHARLSRRHKRTENKRAKEKDPNDLKPEDFVASRIRRVSKGSGRTEDEIRGLISRFLTMRGMFGMLGDMFGGLIPGMPQKPQGLMDKVPGMKMLKQANAMRKLLSDPNALGNLMNSMGGGQMPPGMPNLPGLGGLGGFPGMGGGAPAPERPSSSSKVDYKSLADKRRAEKLARRKNRSK